MIPDTRAHRALLGRTRRSPSRERKGSADRAEPRRRLAQPHARIAAIRCDAAHAALARIGIEDLNVRGMARNRPRARSVTDGAFREFRRQLAYKARMTGAILAVADR